MGSHDAAPVPPFAMGKTGHAVRKKEPVNTSSDTQTNVPMKHGMFMKMDLMEDISAAIRGRTD